MNWITFVAVMPTHIFQQMLSHGKENERRGTPQLVYINRFAHEYQTDYDIPHYDHVLDINTL